MNPVIDDLVSDRQQRLFSCACCRSVWRLLLDDRSRHTIEVVERYADGLASAEELSAARDDALGALLSTEVPERASGVGFGLAHPNYPLPLDPDELALHNGYTRNPAAGAAFASTYANAVGAAEMALAAVSDWEAVPEACQAEAEKQDRFLKDIIRGDIALQLSPAVLDWNDRTVPLLAVAIYEDRQMPEGTLDNDRFAILADALQDAGCDNADVLDHCRGPGPHVRGCWVVDLVLGKE